MALPAIECKYFGREDLNLLLLPAERTMAQIFIK